MTEVNNTISGYKRAGFLAWAIFILGLVTTISLGTWQVKRLFWKEALIAKIEAAQSAAPLTEIPDNIEELATLEFHPFTLQGSWFENIEFHLAARYWHSKLGYHIFQPLQLADGRIAIINRGWVPAENKEIETRPDSRAMGEAHFNATLRIGADRNYFTPPNQPEKNVFFGRDVLEMAQQAGLDISRVIPASFDMIDTSGSIDLPIANTAKIKLRNDHLSYIITWYLLALALIVIFVRYLRLTKRK